MIFSLKSLAKLDMPSCLVLSLSICYVRNKAMSTFGKSFNLLGSSFDSLSVLRNLRVLPKAGSLDFEGWQAKRVSNGAACVPVCVRACGLRVRACVQVQLRLSWSKVVCYQPCKRSLVSKSVTSPRPSWHNMAN